MITEQQISALPKSLVKQLSKKARYGHLTMIEKIDSVIGSDQITADDVLIALFEKYNFVANRRIVTTRITDMVRALKLIRVRKGVYRRPQ